MPWAAVRCTSEPDARRGRAAAGQRLDDEDRLTTAPAGGGRSQPTQTREPSHFFFGFYEAVVRDLTDPATSSHRTPPADSQLHAAKQTSGAVPPDSLRPLEALIDSQSPHFRALKLAAAKPAMAAEKVSKFFTNVRLSDRRSGPLRR